MADALVTLQFRQLERATCPRNRIIHPSEFGRECLHDSRKCDLAKLKPEHAEEVKGLLDRASREYLGKPFLALNAEERAIVTGFAITDKRFFGFIHIGGPVLEYDRCAEVVYSSPVRLATDIELLWLTTAALKFTSGRVGRTDYRTVFLEVGENRRPLHFKNGEPKFLF